jgi:hypothetical protein
MSSLAGRNDLKLGFTTTVKEQVDDIEVSIKIFRSIWSILRNLLRHIENSRVSYSYSLRNWNRQPRHNFNSCINKSAKESII